jgi:hypothetical protein
LCADVATFEDLHIDVRIIFIMDIQKEGVMMTGFFCLIIGTSGRLL